MVEKNFSKITQHAAQTGVLTESMHTSPSVSEACACHSVHSTACRRPVSSSLDSKGKHGCAYTTSLQSEGAQGRPTAHCGQEAVLCRQFSGGAPAEPSAQLLHAAALSRTRCH